MKKFLCFAATVLSLSVIFGAGWASGINKTNIRAQAINTDAPDGRETDEPSPGENRLPDDPKYRLCPRKDKSVGESPDGQDDGKIYFRFEIPSPANRGGYGRLPYVN